jgi:hypothetical protein
VRARGDRALRSVVRLKMIQNDLIRVCLLSCVLRACRGCRGVEIRGAVRRQGDHQQQHHHHHHQAASIPAALGLHCNYVATA